MSDQLETKAQRQQRLNNEAIARRGNSVPRGYMSSRRRYDEDGGSRSLFTGCGPVPTPKKPAS
jgi:hypothetical protein